MKKTVYIKQQAHVGAVITLEHLELMALQEVAKQLQNEIGKKNIHSPSTVKVDSIPLMKLLAFVGKVVGKDMPTMGNVHDELFDINEEEDIMSKNP